MLPGRPSLPGPLGIVNRIMTNRHLVRIILMVAVALGIIAGVCHHFWFNTHVLAADNLSFIGRSGLQLNVRSK